MTISLYTFGGGQMVEAIIRAGLKNKVLSADSVFVTDIAQSRIDYLQQTYGIKAATVLDQPQLTAAQVVLLGVRPQDDWAGLTQTISQSQTQAQVVSIIAGVTIAQLTATDANLPVTRIIPNTLTDTGFGYSGAALNDHADQALVDPFLKSFGKVDYIPEKQIDIYTGYGVAGPNYIYNFYIALTNAGVLAGLSRQQANAVALENLQGAAKMLELTGKNPNELLDINNSAGGVGIYAQHELDASDFAAGIQNAVLAAVRRTTELGAEK